MWQIQFCTYRRWYSELLLLLLLSMYEPPEASRENADVTLKQRSTHLWIADRCTENFKLTLLDKVNRTSLKITWSTGDGRQEVQRVSVNSRSTSINFCLYSCLRWNQTVVQEKLVVFCKCVQISCWMQLYLTVMPKWIPLPPSPSIRWNSPIARDLWKIKRSIWVVTWLFDKSCSWDRNVPRLEAQEVGLQRRIPVTSSPLTVASF